MGSFPAQISQRLLSYCMENGARSYFLSKWNVISNLVLKGTGKSLLLVGFLGKCSWSIRESSRNLALPRAGWLGCRPLSSLSCTIALELWSVLPLFSSLPYSCPMTLIAQLCVARCKASSDVPGSEEHEKSPWARKKGTMVRLSKESKDLLDGLPDWEKLNIKISMAVGYN